MLYRGYAGRFPEPYQEDDLFLEHFGGEWETESTFKWTVTWDDGTYEYYESFDDENDALDFVWDLEQIDAENIEVRKVER